MNLKSSRSGASMPEEVAGPPPPILSFVLAAVSCSQLCTARKRPGIYLTPRSWKLLQQRQRRATLSLVHDLPEELIGQFLSNHSGQDSGT